jgi:hypothetical protein
MLFFQNILNSSKEAVKCFLKQITYFTSLILFQFHVEKLYGYWGKHCSDSTDTSLLNTSICLVQNICYMIVEFHTELTIDSFICKDWYLITCCTAALYT